MSLFPTTAFNTPGLNFGLDLNRDNFICWESLPTDKLNTVINYDIAPLNAAEWKKTAIGSGVTLSTEDYDSLYGNTRFVVETDATANTGVIIGKDGGGAFNITGLTNGRVYTVQLWLMKAGGGLPASRPVRVILRTQSDSVNKATIDGDLTLGSTWVQYTGSFTADASDSNLCIRIFKNPIASAFTFYVAGIMLFNETEAVASQGFNTGVSTDLYENIKKRVISNTSFIGMRPHQKIGDENVATIVCNNDDKFFSPEYTSSPVYGALLPYTRLQIRYDDNWYYTGYIEKCTPSPFLYGDRTATITCFGLKRYMETTPAELEYTASARTDEHITNVLTAFDSTLDLSYIQQGQTTLAYYGDNAYDDEEFTLSVYDVCKQLALLEQGWFYINAMGLPVFYDRHESTGIAISATLDNTAQDIEYASFGEFLINSCKVKVYPRLISSVTTDILWELDQSQVVRQGRVKRFRVPYTDSQSNRCGATDIQTIGGADFVSTGGSPFVSQVNYGQFCRVTVDNTTGTSDCTITTLIVRGRSITYLNPIEVLSEDTDSIADYGRRELVYDMKGLKDIEEGEDLAAFIILLRGQVRGDMKSVTLVSHYQSTDADTQRGIEIGMAINVIDDQLNHDHDYFVVGISHSYSANNMLTSKYNLERVGSDAYWELGVSALGETTALGI